MKPTQPVLLVLSLDGRHLFHSNEKRFQSSRELKKEFFENANASSFY